jgi:hypothetical protein
MTCSTSAWGPIVSAVMGDPVGNNIVASLARPGSNVTAKRRQWYRESRKAVEGSWVSFSKGKLSQAPPRPQNAPMAVSVAGRGKLCSRNTPKCAGSVPRRVIFRSQ